MNIENLVFDLIRRSADTQLPLTRETKMEDLGLDSLDRAELDLDFEEFLTTVIRNCPDQVELLTEKFLTVGEFVAFAEQHLPANVASHLGPAYLITESVRRIRNLTNHKGVLAEADSILSQVKYIK